MLNMLGNAQSAILDLPPSHVFADSELFRFERAAFREAVSVMERMRLPVVALPGFPVPSLRRAMNLPPLLAQMIALKRGGTDADENDYLQGIAGDVEDVAPGQVATFDALLTPGTYELSCFKNTDITGQTMNHYDMGMHTLFTVTPLTPPDAGN